MEHSHAAPLFKAWRITSIRFSYRLVSHFHEGIFFKENAWLPKRRISTGACGTIRISGKPGLTLPKNEPRRQSMPATETAFTNNTHSLQAQPLRHGRPSCLDPERRCLERRCPDPQAARHRSGKRAAMRLGCGSFVTTAKPGRLQNSPQDQGEKIALAVLPCARSLASRGQKG